MTPKLSWFVEYFLRYRKPLLHFLTASIFIHVLSIVFPLAAMVVVDRVVTSGTVETLYIITSGLIGCVFFQVGLGWASNRLFNVTSLRIASEYAGTINRHLLRLPISFFNATTAGETITRINEIDKIKGLVEAWALGRVVELSFAALFFAVMFALSPVMAFLIAATIPLLALSYAIFGPASRAAVQENFVASANYQSLLIESLSNIETIKSFNAESRIVARLDGAFGSYAETVDRINVISAKAGTYNGVLNGLSESVVLFLGAYLVIHGELTLGKLFAFNLISGRVVSPLLGATSLWQNYLELQNSIRRLSEILAARAESIMIESEPGLPAKQQGGHVVEYRQATFCFRPDQPVIRDIDLCIPKNGFVALIGPSGAGKSTLTKLLPRIYELDHGEILIDGKPIQSYPLEQLRQMVTYIPQDSRIFRGTVRENIVMFSDCYSHTEVLHAAHTAALDDFVSKLPQMYDTPLEEFGANLSGGQRQRIGIARGVLRRSPVLILDEATSALDPETEGRMFHELRKACADRTVIVITHRMSVTSFADRVVLLDDGCVAADGEHTGLLANNPRYRQFVRQWNASRSTAALPIR